ncbi:MAG: ribbon-helix-helix protein, CopG family [Planctomycetota bacterium]|nr:ribbon-helix-helix protein, CopG family [Planctomycetota bacterium]
MEETLTASVGVRMPPRLLKTLDAAARKESRSTGSIIRILLEEALATRKRRGK